MAFNRTYNPANVDTDRAATAQIIPPGEYDVIINSAEECISKTSGKNMLKLELNIITPPYDKRKLWYYIVDDQYADQKFYDIFSSAGKNVPTLIHAGVFRGLRCRVKTKNRLYNNENQAEVNYWIIRNGEKSPSAGVDPTMGPAASNASASADDIQF